MTARTDNIADRVRHGRAQRHREEATRGGACRFIRDAAFWSAAAAALLALFGVWAWFDDTFGGFRTDYGPRPSPADGWVVLGAVAFAFGLFMAWCTKRVRDAARERWMRREARTAVEPR
jgi:hypothetical protein